MAGPRKTLEASPPLPLLAMMLCSSVFLVSDGSNVVGATIDEVDEFAKDPTDRTGAVS